jgi:isoleucyl-tRNA synthetase
MGPLTLAWQLTAEGIPLVTQPVYRAAIGRYLQRLAHWQIDRLTQWGIPVLFFLDEPCLGMVPFPSETPQKEMLAVQPYHSGFGGWLSDRAVCPGERLVPVIGTLPVSFDRQ